MQIRARSRVARKDARVCSKEPSPAIIFIRTHTYIYIYIYHIQFHILIYIIIHMYNIYIYIHTFYFPYICIYIHTYNHVYTYPYIYIYTYIILKEIDEFPLTVTRLHCLENLGNWLQMGCQASAGEFLGCTIRSDQRIGLRSSMDPQRTFALELNTVTGIDVLFPLVG